MDANALTSINYNGRFRSRFAALAVDILDVDHFSAALLEYKCVVAGSFPLQCLLDEHYEQSHIDVYVRAVDEDDPLSLTDFEKWLQNVAAEGRFRKGIQTPMQFQEGKWELCPIEPLSSDEDCQTKGVLVLRSYGISPTFVIHVFVTEDVESTVNAFGLSFSRTTFDGQRFTYLPASLQKIGFVNESAYEDACAAFLARVHHFSDQYARGELAHGKHVKCHLYPHPKIALLAEVDDYTKRRGFTIKNIDFIKQLQIL